MKEGTGLKALKSFPDRLFDVELAEEHCRSVLQPALPWVA